MVDPPDLKSKDSTHLLNGNIATYSVDLLSNNGIQGRRIRKSRRAPNSSSHLTKLSLGLLLCILALLLPCTLGHVLPTESNSNAIEARSTIQYDSLHTVDMSTLEKRADLISGQQDEVNKRNIHYLPTRQYKSVFPRMLRKRESEKSKGTQIGFAFIIIILVLLSGVFAGLTLGYMSLDETQLQVLMTTGDDTQRARAAKIMPIRKDGHLLLTTLLIANMITNETLPIIFDQLLPQVPSVVISTVLIVIFAELIPQSTCSRYGLQIGAYMALPTRIIIIMLWPVAYPVSRILHWVLGPHHGIVYRRAELKELVTMHAASGGRGGDLKGDTVMIVGGALDLQEKVVKQAMTPIDQVFMLPFTAKLDYPTLEKVVRSGHSRIPIYQEIEVQISPAKSGTTTPKKKIPLLASFTRKTSTGPSDDSAIKNGSPKLDGKDTTGFGDGTEGTKTVIRKKIVGTLLVKSCVLLDPEDAVPVSSMVINALPTVPGDEPLLNVLNVFQEGRSHMAIVSPRSRRGMSDSIADLGSKSNLWRSSQGPPLAPGASAAPRVDGLGNIDEEKQLEGANDVSRSDTAVSDDSNKSSPKSRPEGSPKRKHIWSRAFGKVEGKEGLEQTVPADATINEKKLSGSHDLRKWDSQQSTNVQAEDESGLPLGIITLEDVLEELLGEEILDEYDDRGNEEQDFRNLMPPPSPEHGISAKDHEVEAEAEQGMDEKDLKLPGAAIDPVATNNTVTGPSQSMAPPKKTVLTRLGISRQKSQRDSSGTSPPTNVLTDEPSSIEQVTGGEFASPTPGLLPPPGDYFEGRLQRPERSSSVPPSVDRILSEEGRGRSHSRPQTPSGAAGAAGLPTPSLYSPQANRPVVIRTQAPGGGQVTTIAAESLLRGRQPSLPTSGTPGPVSSSAAAVAAAPPSRSQTPAGGAGGAGGTIKGHRFKSQAAVGVGGTTTGATAVQPIRSRSQAPPATSQDLSASIGSLEDAGNKKEGM